MRTQPSSMIASGLDPWDALAVRLFGPTVRMSGEGKKQLRDMVARLARGNPSMQAAPTAVLAFRYGLGATYTLQALGDLMGVTKVRIAQIENNALKKLRHPSRRKLLKEHFLGPGNQGGASYTYSVSVSFDMQFTFDESQVAQAAEGSEGDLEPSDKAIGQIESELTEYLSRQYSEIRNLEASADFESLLEVDEGPLEES